jgi:hypothetical protein
MSETKQTAERRRMVGVAFQLRIAKLQIKLHGLNDTPEEYVAKCIKRTQAKATS